MGIDLSVRIGNLKLKNPVMVASGTFGYGNEYEGIIDLKKLGALITKTITLQPRQGNLPPRTCETPCGMLNSIGLENPGVDIFIKEKLKFLKRIGIPIIVSIGSEGRADDFVKLARILDKTDGVDALELNISCPNIRGHRTEDRGQRLIAQNPKLTYEVVKAVRSVTYKTLIAKLSPNVTDIVSIAKSAETGGADCISLVNTFQAMAIDVQTRTPKLGSITGGLSGPCIKPIALKMVWDMARAVNIPVIGLGGIMSADDALEFFIAGACAVGVGTANFVNPFTCIEIINGIKSYFKHKGLKRMDEIISRMEAAEC